MEYTKERAEEIYYILFGVRNNLTGQSALSSYRNMMHNIKLNYTQELEAKANKLNKLITPYCNDIKSNPNKIL